MSGGQGSLSISRLPFSPFTGPGPGYPEAEPQADTVTAGVSDRRQLLLEVPIERRPGNPQGLADVPDGGALICGQRLQLFNLAGTYSSTVATAGRLSVVLGAAVVGGSVLLTPAPAACSGLRVRPCTRPEP